MDERKLIAALNEKYPIREGSKPKDLTPLQQRAANLAGNLLIHAHKRGKRKKGRWL